MILQGVKGVARELTHRRFVSIIKSDRARNGRQTSRLLERGAACDAATDGRSPKWTRLELRWSGRYFYFARFFGFSLTNGHDANPSLPVGTDTDRAVLDLLPDKLLDFGSVCVGFEVTPVGIIRRLSHGYVPSKGKL